MPYTLLDQDALDGELQLCEQHGARVVIGAVFASGILAAPASVSGSYGYGAPSDAVSAKVRRLHEICEHYDVSLIAAALQFPLAHPTVASVIPGATAPGQVEQNVAAFRTDIPGAFWHQLRAEGLIREDAPVPQ